MLFNVILVNYSLSSYFSTRLQRNYNLNSSYLEAPELVYIGLLPWTTGDAGSWGAWRAYRRRTRSCPRGWGWRWRGCGRCASGVFSLRQSWPLCWWTDLSISAGSRSLWAYTPSPAYTNGSFLFRGVILFQMVIL